MDAKIIGATLPVLEITLAPGEKLVAETGELAWKTPNIAMRTAIGTGGARGFLGALGRAVSGGGLFMTEYVADGQPGQVSFAARVPGSILEEQVGGGHFFMAHNHGFLCGSDGITLTTGFQRSLGSGVFGGAGFLLQKIAGEGRAWVELGGEVVTYDLAPGQALDVHPGHVGMFSDSVQFDITTVPGLANKIFGGDGMFLARLTGPGRIWLQSLTLPNLAHALVPYLPTKKE